MQSVTLEMAASSPPGLNHPNELAQDDANLYVTITDANLVLRVAKADNAQTPLDTTAEGPLPIVAEVDANGAATFIVWGETGLGETQPSKGVIRRCDLPGGTPPCATQSTKAVAAAARSISLTERDRERSDHEGRETLDLN